MLLECSSTVECGTTERLGLTGKPEIELRSVESNWVVRVRVHGVLRPYSPALAERVKAALVLTDLGDSPETPETALQSNSPDASLGQQDLEPVFEYLARLVLEVIQERPACLVGPAQVAAYLRNGPGEWVDLRPSASIEALSSVLESLLDLRVFVADKSLVLQMVNADYAPRRAVEDMVEEAFVWLRSSKIEIHAHPQYLEALAAGEPTQEPLSVYAEQFSEDLRSLFRSLESMLSNDLGLRLPDLVWVPSRDVPEGMIAVKINDRLKPPAPAPRLQEPQIVAVVYGELTRSADLLLSVEDVEYLLAQLAQSHPVLVRIVMARFSIGDITRVLRGLLREGISIENPRAILERLLQYEAISVGSNGYTIFDDRFVSEEGAQSAHDWKNYREFVRSGLKDYMGYKYAQGQNRLRVFSIDPDLEASLEATATNAGETDERAGGLDEAEQEALRHAIWNALKDLADTSAGPPVVLTTSSARAKLRELIAPELPDLPVLARSELPRGINADSVATISLA